MNCLGFVCILNFLGLLLWCHLFFISIAGIFLVYICICHRLYSQLQDCNASSFDQFLEVSCRSSGKTRRFAAGTEAGFALLMINKKLPIGVPPALFIEAFREGEEPVTFGPNAKLVIYGEEWKLQTVTEKGNLDEFY